MSKNVLKKVASSLAFATALAGAASMVNAADLDQPKASSWTGLYAGGYFGAGAIVNNIEVPGFGAGNFNGIGGEGILGGGMAGFNYQIDPRFVVGLQGDIGFSNLDAVLNIPGLVTASAGSGLTASISARAGWLTTQDTLLYIIGGYSYAKFKAKASIPLILATFTAKQNYHGFHVGTGIETRISSNLTARLEYRYTQYSGKDWGTGGILKVEPSSHAATVGLAWQFYNLNSGQTVTPVADLDPISTSWTGLYVGAYIGAGAVVSDIKVPGLGAGNFNGIGGEGVLGGGMIGFNYQISPNFVVGLQGDIGFGDLDSKLNIPGIINASAGPEYTASISARAGWLATQDTLMYVIGGYSRAKFKATASIPLIPATFSAKQNYDGFHAGTGIETRLSPNLTARLEYRYTQYAGKDWGTGGILKIVPSSHAATVGLAWNFGNLLH